MALKEKDEKKRKNFYLKLFKIVSLAYIFSGINLFLGYFIRLIGARSLSEYDFGLVYSIINLFSFFLLLTDFGVAQALVYYFFKLEDKKRKNKLLSFVLSFELFCSILFVIIFLLFKDVIKHLLGIHNDTLFYLATVFLFINSLIIFFRQYYQITIKPELNSFFHFLRMFIILTISLTMFFIFKIKNASSFLIAWIFGNFFYLLSTSILFFKDFKINNFYFSFKSFKEHKELFKLGIKMFFASLAYYLMYYIDNFFITVFLSPLYFAYYSIAYSILNLPNFLFSSLSNAFYPITSKFSNSENYKKELKNFFELLIFLVLPFTLAFFIFSKEIIFVLFGKKYLKAEIILKIFSIFLIFKLLNNYFINILNGLKEVNYLNKIFIIGSLFNIFFDSLSIFLINEKEKALYFIALATSFSWVLITILGLIKLKGYFLKDFCFFCLREKLIKLILANIVFLNFVFGLKELLIKLKINYWIIFGIEFVFSTLFYLLTTKYLKLWPKILEEIYNTILEEIKEKVQIRNKK